MKFIINLFEFLTDSVFRISRNDRFIIDFKREIKDKKKRKKFVDENVSRVIGRGGNFI